MQTPRQPFGNVLGTLYNTKISKNQNCLEINIQTIPTISQNQSQLKLKTTSSYKN
jgi:hypothetical protein